MRRFLIFVLALFSHQVSADHSSLFHYDAGQLTLQLGNLEQLERIIEADGNVSFDEIKNTEGGRNLRIDHSLKDEGSDGPLGLPSFLWGCVLGVVGILIVYFVTEDSKETTKALVGCLVSCVVGCVAYFGFYAFALGYGVFWQ